MNIPIHMARRLFTLLSDVLSTTKVPKDLAQQAKLERAALDILIQREEAGPSEERLRQMQIALEPLLKRYNLASSEYGFVEDLLRVWPACESPAHAKLYEGTREAYWLLMGASSSGRPIESAASHIADRARVIEKLQKLLGEVPR